MLVRVAKGRNGVKVENREDFDAGTTGDELLVLCDAAVVFRVVPRKENDDCVQVGAGKPTHPMLGRMRAGIAEHLRPRRHALLELLGKRGKRGLIQSKRAKPVPGEGRRHPALVLIDAAAHRRGRVNLLLDCRHPGAAARSITKRQKLVACRQRRGAGQQQVLDVVEFEHRDVPV